MHFLEVVLTQPLFFSCCGITYTLKNTCKRCIIFPKHLKGSIPMKIKTENLTKIFPSRNKKQKENVVAVNNFSLEIEDGQLCALLGPSGCGKSTVLNLLSGLLKADDGRIVFGEDDVTLVSAENRGVGLVFQSYALYPHLTVLQNIMFPLENRKGKDKLSKKQMTQMATEAATLVQIEEYLGRKPSELSGGQQQRVAIARALVKQPKILLLDEPLSNLDARLRLKTREEIRRIQRATGITTVFVTHDQEEAMSISDVVVVMREGVIQQKGKPQEVYDNPANLFVAKFLGTPPVNVFDGEIKDGQLFIGNEAVMEYDAPDTKADVAIRPEGLFVNENGVLTCAFQRVEVMGRDVSIVATHENSLSGKIRAVVDSDVTEEKLSDKVCFDIKKNKIYVFDKVTGERI